jgi:O-antigen ligase
LRLITERAKTSAATSWRIARERDSVATSLAMLLAAALLVRVLVDDRAGAGSRHSGSLDLSAAIAGLLLLTAGVALLLRRAPLRPAVLALLWLTVWTAIAVGTNGASGETLREGVREASVVAVGVIAYAAWPALTVKSAARLAQLVALVPAVVAIGQLVDHSGLDVGGQLRANGTLAHPDSAAMFFALAALVSTWCWLQDGRRLVDATAVAVFVVALIATFSVGGVATLTAMTAALALLRAGSRREKVLVLALACAIPLAFFATPLGGRRLTRETATSLLAEQRGEPNTSLAWRLHKWKLLLPEWERSPAFGEGLGTTVTPEPIPGDRYAGEPPHNEYVRYLVETGVVGLALLLAALAWLLARLASARRLEREARGSSPNGATLAIVVLGGCLVNSLAGNTLLNSPTGYVAALIVFAAFGRSALATRSRRS